MLLSGSAMYQKEREKHLSLTHLPQRLEKGRLACQSDSRKETQSEDFCSASKVRLSCGSRQPHFESEQEKPLKKVKKPQYLLLPHVAFSQEKDNLKNASEEGERD